MVVIQRPTMRSAWVGEIILPLLVTGVAFGFGYHKLMQPSVPTRALKMVLVQPSIPQTLIWDAKESTNRFEQLLRLSEQALTNKPDVLIWPEAAVPTLSEENYRAITNLIRIHKIWMIFGADDAERAAAVRDAKRARVGEDARDLVSALRLDHLLFLDLDAVIFGLRVEHRSVLSCDLQDRDGV